MSNSKGFEITRLSRRGLLRRAAIGGGAALSLGLADAALAQTKVSQKLCNYQSTPKGKDRCDICVQWQAPASCKVVQGVISPTGWCSLYAPKS